MSNAQIQKYKTKQSCTLTILETVHLFNHTFSIDTKGPLNPASEKNHYLYVTFDQFSNYIVTVPTPKNRTHYAVDAIFYDWISEFGPLQYLSTDGKMNILILTWQTAVL